MTRGRKFTGRVVIIGAGPGDVELLTARATAALNSADTVLHDADVSTAILEQLAQNRPDLEVHPAVGDPAEVAKVSIATARAGQTVGRLVAGDPFTNDAVVKEILVIAKTTVPYDVIPGVAISTAVPAYAGVPLGSMHTAADLRSGMSAAALASSPAPLVLQATGEIVVDAARDLIGAGMSGTTPACVTSDGSLSSQFSLAVTLDELAGGSWPSNRAGPVVLTVGSEVDKRSRLSWWESRPLFGWRVLVPRTREQAGDMSERLRAYGAVPVEVPTIAVEPPRTPAQMDRAIRGLVTGRYGWIVFTSVNAVRAVREKFAELGLDARAFAGVKVACVGEMTADAVRDFGITPELLPSGEQSSMGLLEDFPPYDDVLDPIDRILLPRADIATETLTAGLQERGWEVDDVTAYRTVRAAPPPAAIREAIKGGGFDAVCFTSSSTVRNLVGIAGKPNGRTIVACIGPQTASTATEFGLRVDVQPETAGVLQLVDALADHAIAARAEDSEGGGDSGSKDAAPPPRSRGGSGSGAAGASAGKAGAKVP